MCSALIHRGTHDVGWRVREEDFPRNKREQMCAHVQWAVPLLGEQVMERHWIQALGGKGWHSQRSYLNSSQVTNLKREFTRGYRSVHRNEEKASWRTRTWAAACNLSSCMQPHDRINPTNFLLHHFIHVKLKAEMLVKTAPRREGRLVNSVTWRLQGPHDSLAGHRLCLLAGWFTSSPWNSWLGNRTKSGLTEGARPGWANSNFFSDTQGTGAETSRAFCSILSGRWKLKEGKAALPLAFLTEENCDSRASTLICGRDF